APEVFDWEHGRAFITLTWGDAEFRFPPPASVRFGGEAALTTTVAKPTDAAGRPTNYKVRYRIVGGAPAALVRQSGSAGTYSADAQEAEALADADGAAGVRVTQPAPQPGKPRVAVEVVKPDPNGVGPGTVVGRTETAVEWAAPQLSLDATLPPAVALNRDASATITLANAGRVDSSSATVRAAVPEGAEFVSADPAPTRRAGRDLAWDLGSLPGGGKRDITPTVRPTRRGALTLPVSAEAEGGLRADK